jgi:hypothetical protein
MLEHKTPACDSELVVKCAPLSGSVALLVGNFHVHEGLFENEYRVAPYSKKCSIPYIRNANLGTHPLNSRQSDAMALKLAFSPFKIVEQRLERLHVVQSFRAKWYVVDWLDPVGIGCSKVRRINLTSINIKPLALSFSESKHTEVLI